MRSRQRPLLLLHVALGVLVSAMALAHAGPRLKQNPAGALYLCFGLAVLLGAFGALAYRALPARLSRLERRGALPEDLPAEREELVDRLHREASGRDDLVKSIVEKILIPYTRSAFGPLLLLVSGRSLKQEELLLRARIDGILEGRGGDRLAGLDDLLRTVVELRALPARRALNAALRAWLPLHAALGVVLLVLLVLHVYGVVRP